jgi:hypothetical protein
MHFPKNKKFQTQIKEFENKKEKVILLYSFLDGYLGGHVKVGDKVWEILREWPAGQP